MTESFTDFLGQEIKVGDFVVYATISGKSPVQKFARVEKIVPIVNTTYLREDGTYNKVETPSVKVGVKEIKNGRGFMRWDSYDWAKNDDGSYQKDEKGLPIRIDKEVRTTYPMKANMVKVRDGVTDAVS